MEASDCENIALIEHSSFSTPWTLSSFENELKNSNATYFVAELSGKIVGYIGVHNVLDEGEITTFAVDKEFRGMGYGKSLIEHLLMYEKSNNISKIFLEVRENNISARKLYEKTGFLVYGQRNDYYTNPTENAVLMIKTF